jgi:hypothetical protein
MITGIYAKLLLASVNDPFFSYKIAITMVSGFLVWLKVHCTEDSTYPCLDTYDALAIYNSQKSVRKNNASNNSNLFSLLGW